MSGLRVLLAVLAIGCSSDADKALGDTVMQVGALESRVTQVEFNEGLDRAQIEDRRTDVERLKLRLDRLEAWARDRGYY